MPFIIGGICFARYDNAPVQRVSSDIKTSPFFPTAEDFMFREYDYDAFELSHSLNSLLSILKKVNFYDPQTRAIDAMDVWFKQATHQLMHEGKCLAYIEHYGHLEDTFWLNMAELNLRPEQDETFQKLLISCYKTSWGIWTRNFSNLLWHFGRNYQLLPEVEKILNTDSRLKDALRTYNSARESSERDKLKATNLNC